jgi:hypothetical protein
LEEWIFLGFWDPRVLRTSEGSFFRRLFKQPPYCSDASLALPRIYFKVISSNINKSKYSFWCNLMVVAQASPSLPKIGPYDLRGNSSLPIFELRLILPVVDLPP